MSQYKIFDLDELKYLEKDFVQFLSANGIDAGHWDKLINHNDTKVQEILEEFSRFIYETVLDRTEILEVRNKDFLTMFYATDLKIHFIRIENKTKGIFNYEQEFKIDSFLKFIENNTSEISVIKGEKKIRDTKKSEFYNLLKSSCKISQNYELLEILKKLIKKD